MMKKYKSQYAYTLEEVIEGLYPLSSVNKYYGKPTYQDLCTDTQSIITQIAIYLEYYNTIWQLVRLRFRNEIVLINDEEITSWDSTLIYEFWLKFNAILRMTGQRYVELLAYYDNAKTKLLDKVKTITSRTGNIASTNSTNSTNKNRINDTPQSGADFTTDPYTTQASEATQAYSATDNSDTTDDATSETDLNTYMSRLGEIQDKYENVLENWSKEFEKIFIEGDNLEYEE